MRAPIPLGPAPPPPSVPVVAIVAGKHEMYQLPGTLTDFASASFSVHASRQLGGPPQGAIRRRLERRPRPVRTVHRGVRAPGHDREQRHGQTDAPGPCVSATVTAGSDDVTDS
jgi:hypothetical protein